MDGNSRYSYNVESQQDTQEDVREDVGGNGHINIGQVQRLIRLLDNSDVSEVEIRRADEGMRLVLRKAKVSEGVGEGEYPVGTLASGEAGEETSAETKRIVTAPLVGIFHTWGKPKGKALVAPGDQVKIGQLLGTIQSLNVINEVESPVAGRVIEILVQDGQAVEYGQQLITIESSEEG